MATIISFLIKTQNLSRHWVSLNRPISKLDHRWTIAGWRYWEKCAAQGCTVLRWGTTCSYFSEQTLDSQLFYGVSHNSPMTFDLVVLLPQGCRVASLICQHQMWCNVNVLIARWSPLWTMHSWTRAFIKVPLFWLITHSRCIIIPSPSLFSTLIFHW